MILLCVISTRALLSLFLLLGCIVPTPAPPITVPTSIDPAGSAPIPSPDAHAHAHSYQAFPALSGTEGGGELIPERPGMAARLIRPRQRPALLFAGPNSSAADWRDRQRSSHLWASCRRPCSLLTVHCSWRSSIRLGWSPTGPPLPRRMALVWSGASHPTIWVAKFH